MTVIVSHRTCKNCTNWWVLLCLLEYWNNYKINKYLIMWFLVPMREGRLCQLKSWFLVSLNYVFHQNNARALGGKKGENCVGCWFVWICIFIALSWLTGFWVPTECMPDKLNNKVWLLTRLQTFERLPNWEEWRYNKAM